MFKEENRWRVGWSDGYLPKSLPQKFKTGLPVIYVIPEKVRDWHVLLVALSGVDGKSLIENWQIIKGFVPYKYPIRVSIITEGVRAKDLDYLKNLSGVVISDE